MRYFFLFAKQLIKCILRGNFLILKQIIYYKRWRKCLSSGRSPLLDQIPWLTFPAIDFLNRHMHQNVEIFEYGGGGSTLFFLNRAKRVITVEHDPVWFDLIRDNIRPNKSNRWQGNLIEPECPVITAGLDKSMPSDCYSGVSKFQNATFKSYSHFIDNFSDACFDMILIDGRARTSCLYKAIDKVKSGGYLILDNSERSYYLKHNAKLLKNTYRLLLHEMAAVPYDRCFSRTSIWQKL